MNKKSLMKWVFVSVIVLTMCLGTVGSAWAKKEIVLDFVSFIPVKMFEFSRWKVAFIDKVNKQAKGKLKIRVRGGPEVIPQFDQAMAVKKGIVHMMYSPSGFFTSVVPGLDSWRLSELTAQEERDTGAFDVISEMCEKAGYKYLGRALTANQGIFWLFTNKKAEKPEDFKGMKIGASPSFHGYTKGLGAVNTSIQISEYYSAMERGIVDAFTASLGVYMGIGAYEVTKYVLDEPYYATNSALLVNLKKWNSIPEDLQKIIEKAAIEQEKAWPTIRDAEEKRLRGIAEKAGVEFYKLSPEVKKWYYDAAYETAWKEDAKRFPPEIVQKLKSVLKKK
jgi:TRAP-type transport system periplasmic protein